MKVKNQNGWKMSHGQMRNIVGGRLGNKEQGTWSQEEQHDNQPRQQDAMNKQNADT